MEIIKEQTAAQSAMIHVKIVPGDYESRVETVLKDYRRKAKIPGFRPGMVPSGIVRKMYGKYVLAEEVSKLVSESLSEYFSRNRYTFWGTRCRYPETPTGSRKQSLNSFSKSAWLLKFRLICPRLTSSPPTPSRRMTKF
jgi:hypothetical protein